MLIYNADIYTMEESNGFSGYLLMEGKTITAIGSMKDCPIPQRGDLDAQGKQLYPGFVDAHCHIGLLADGLSYDDDDCNESTDPVTPELRAIDAVYPLDYCFQEAREAGITTVMTGPGSGNAICGQFTALKTAGRWIDDMIVKAPAAMKCALGENPKSVYADRKEAPMTRMATAALLREAFTKALEYGRKKSRAEADPDEDAPDFDAKLEALLPVVCGKLRVQFHAHRADDIATAVRLAKEFQLDYVIVHGTEGYLVADILAEQGVRVITGPIIGDRSKPELSRQRIENTAKLAQAGVKVAICTDHPENPEQYLILSAALAAKHGLDRMQALRAITIDAAALIGIADRVGSLAVGKDADCVLFDKHPFELDAAPAAVFVDGKRVK